jgi:CHAD domain-containing protein
MELLPLAADPAESYHIEYYDSFEWQLFRDGKALKWEQRDADSRCYLYALEDGAVAASVPSREPPARFPAELPAGNLRSYLEPLLGLRALLPVASLITRSYCLRLCDPEGKTLARVFLEQHRLRKADQKPRLLDKQICVVPLRGYDKAAAKLIRTLEQKLGLQPDHQDLLLRALAALGTDPAAHSARLDIALQADQRADAALRSILLVLLDGMERNEAGLIEDLDSEFLHDFRVAVRRTRSALGQMKSVFPPATLQRYRREFAWLGDITSPTRDLDVYLLKFGDYQQQLPKSMRADLAPLREFLVRHHRQEQARLAAELGRAHYRRLKRSWRAYLTSPLPQRPRVPDARKPILEVARRRTWRIYRRVMREGRAITPHTPADDLHELRKSCKKLRYLMEFFRSLFARAEMRKLTRELKVLQDNLGDFQDLEVQTSTLAHYEEQMREEGHMNARTEQAMHTLRAGLHQRMHAVRGEFQDRFAHFSRTSNRQRFRRLFKPQPEQ